MGFFFLVPEKQLIWPVDLNRNNLIVLLLLLLEQHCSSQCVVTVPCKQWAVVMIRKAYKMLLVAVKIQQKASDELQIAACVSLSFTSVKLQRRGSSMQSLGD